MIRLFIVIPAQAGIHTLGGSGLFETSVKMDTRLRGNDG